MGEEHQVPVKEEQIKALENLSSKPLRPGDIWCLVSYEWMNTWKEYLRNVRDLEPPGPIDNGSLLDAGHNLKLDSIEGTNYELVPEELWTKMVQWHGIVNDYTPLMRRVIELRPNYNVVDVHLFRLKCSNDLSFEPSIYLNFSRTASMKTVEEKLRSRFNLDSNVETRLWLCSLGSSLEPVDTDQTLEELGVTPKGYCVVIESKKLNTNWSARSEELIKKKSSNDNDSSNFSNAKVSRMSTQYKPGLCGLANLGNTCFMNSVLQCMSNCPPITEYFLVQRHLEELNRTNPLGMRGEIATAFGTLIGTMWSGNHGHTNPFHFKIQLGKFNPVFSGCQQHDSQELLTFLLDGLHEDLNRIKQKPYTEINDDSDREDKILAQEAWDRHRKRNDSIIVDTFHGLLKSRVVCPECRKFSVTFDPFCYLSLPLPQKKDRLINITFVPFDGTQPSLKHRLSIPCQGFVKELCREVGHRTTTDPKTLLVAEVMRNHFHKFYSSEDSLDSIHSWEPIFVYEVPALSDDPKQLIIPVCLWEIDENADKFEQFGVPFFIVVPKRPISEEHLRVQLLNKMSRNINASLLNGHNPNTMDMDNGDIEIVNQVLEEIRFSIYTKAATGHNPPTPLNFDNRKLNLTSLFDVDEGVFGRNTMILGFSKELRKKVYFDKPIVLSNDKSHAYRSQKDRFNIDDCLSLFTTCEKLGADNAWYCPTCKKHQRATKKFDLWDLPKILIVHLKRFSYTRSLRDKIDVMVDCPIKNLDMSKYLIKWDRPQSVYNLIGVCNHYGGMGGGHYTASCKNRDTGEWYNFDDSHVERISEDKVLTSHAYVLFYMAADVP